MIKFWQWPNILAIDAALVAVGWHYLITREFSLVGSPSAALILGLSVWLTYMGDRWFDARKVPLKKLGTLRHRFTHKHQRPLFITWTAVLCCDIALAFTLLEQDDFLAGIVLLIASIVYTALNQSKILALKIPKELLVSLIFTAGLMAFNLDHPIVEPLGLALTLIAFFMLCLYNCALLAKAEIEIDRQQSTSSMVQQNETLASHLYLLGFCAIGLSAFLAIKGQPFLSASVCFIALFYLALDKWQRQLSPETLRVLTDSSLLLPCLIVYAF